MSVTQVRLRSESRMSNSGYHRAGRAFWWVRIGQGDSAQFVKIPSVRGDSYLDVTVEIPEGVNEVVIGCGSGKDSCREVVKLPEREESR